MDQLNTHKSSGFLQKIKEPFLISLPLVFLALQLILIKVFDRFEFVSGQIFFHNHRFLFYNSLLALVVLFVLLFKLAKTRSQKTWFYVWLGISFFFSQFQFILYDGRIAKDYISGSLYGIFGREYPENLNIGFVLFLLAVFVLLLLIIGKLKINRIIPGKIFLSLILTYYFAYWFIMHDWYLMYVYFFGFLHRADYFGAYLYNSLIFGTFFIVLFIFLLNYFKNLFGRILLSGGLMISLFAISNFFIIDLLKNNYIIPRDLWNISIRSWYVDWVFGYFVDYFLFRPLLHINIILTVFLIMFYLIKVVGWVIEKVKPLCEGMAGKRVMWFLEILFSIPSLILLLSIFIFFGHILMIVTNWISFVVLVASVYGAILWALVKMKSTAKFEPLKWVRNNVFTRFLKYIIGVGLLFVLLSQVYGIVIYKEGNYYDFFNKFRDFFGGVFPSAWFVFAILSLAVFVVFYSQVKSALLSFKGKQKWNFKEMVSSFLLISGVIFLIVFVFFPSSKVRPIDKQLWDAVTKGDMVQTKALIDQGADVGIRNFGNNTLLHVAPAKMIKFLLKQGLDINQKNGWGETPLRKSLWLDMPVIDENVALDNYRKIVILLGCNAEVSCKDEEIITQFKEPRLVAEYMQSYYEFKILHKWEFVKSLVRENDNSEDEVVKRYAVEYLEEIGIKRLVGILDARGEINLQDVNGMSPLHYAVVLGDRDFAKRLVSKGAEILLKDNDGFTSRQLAIQKGHGDMVVFFDKVLSEMK